jgi:hypothetical protein
MQIKPTKIEIESTDIETFSGESKGSGKPFTLIKQPAYIFLNGSKYPEKIELLLEEKQPPFNIGVYYVDMNTCVSVDRYKSPSIDMRKAKFLTAEQIKAL